VPSVRQNLLDYLATYLAGELTTGNGYNYTAAQVARGVKYPEEIAGDGFPAIFISTSDEQRNNISRFQFKAKINVAFFCMVKNDAGTTGVQAQLDKLVADLGKALEKDRTQNGIVLWSSIDRIKTDAGDSESYAVAMMDVAFNYTQSGVTP
jgi:hypothetical protein